MLYSHLLQDTKIWQLQVNSEIIQKLSKSIKTANAITQHKSLEIFLYKGLTETVYLYSVSLKILHMWPNRTPAIQQEKNPSCKY